MTLRGEYWITNFGDVIYCDGDAGVDVPNHAMVVVIHAWSMIIDGVDGVGNAAAKSLLASIDFNHDDNCLDITTLTIAASVAAF